MKNPKINDESIESYTQPVSDHIDTADSGVIIDLKNDLGKMKKRSRPCVIRWHKLSKLNEPEQYYMTMLQLYFPWRCQNELKSNGQYSHKYMQVYQMIVLNTKRF